MPELPEVEVTRLGLLPTLPGRRVVRVSWSGKRLRKPLPRKLLLEHIQGATFVTVDRRAKYLLFRLAGGACMVLHLGMTGKLSLVDSNEPPAGHDHLRLLLDNGRELRFNDVRRFGSVLVWPPADALPQERALDTCCGVEPFGETFSGELLSRLAGTRTKPVKNFLMDARLVAGIGNIYANEILFAAGVHPLAPVNLIPPEKWDLIAQSTRRILREAIRAGGSTISDFLGTSGNPGYFQVHFQVYRRLGEPCTCGGANIRKTVVGGRATYFCPVCQVFPAKKLPAGRSGSCIGD